MSIRHCVYLANRQFVGQLFATGITAVQCRCVYGHCKHPGPSYTLWIFTRSERPEGIETGPTDKHLSLGRDLQLLATRAAKDALTLSRPPLFRLGCGRGWAKPYQGNRSLSPTVHTRPVRSVSARFVS